ncbi:MAG: sulfate transporter [Microcystis aeruginosa W13-11]|nr:sulfate transporter [Microcystis aeruginosa W13-11]
MTMVTFAMARVKQDLDQQLKKGDPSENISTERIYATLEKAIEAFHHRNPLPSSPSQD